MTIEQNSGAPTEAQQAEALSQEILDVFGLDLGDDEPASKEPAAAQPSDAGAGGDGPAPQAPPVSPDGGQPPSIVPVAAPAGPSAQPGGQPPAVQAPVAQQPAAQSPAAPSQEQLDLAALRQQNEALTARLAALGAQPQKPAPEAGGQPPATAEVPLWEAVPQYALQVPPEVAAMVFGEDADQAKKGLEHIINSIVTITHLNVRKEVAERLKHEMAPLNGYTQQQQQSQAEQERAALQQQYWDAFPQHNTARVRLLVTEAAQEITTENPQLQWGPEVIAAIGARVNKYLTELGAPVGQQPAAAQQPAGKPVPRAPAPSLNGGLDPAASAPQSADLTDEIASMFEL